MISATVLTKNSEKYLEQVLASLAFLDEVVVYDNGSQDQTLEIASRFPNVSLFHGTFEGFGPTHNKASNLAKHDWIFSVDSDEVVTLELQEEIQNLKLDLDTVYSVPRHNQYRGRTIKGCGWSPDRVVRLYNRTKTSFTDTQVHEKVKSEGLKLVLLTKGLNHFSYENLKDFLSKMQHYSELFAQDRAGKVTSSPCKALLHGLFSFFRSYVIKKGFLDGYPGFVISSYNGHTAFYKYLKLYELNLNLSKQAACGDLKKKGSLEASLSKSTDNSL